MPTRALACRKWWCHASLMRLSLSKLCVACVLVALTCAPIVNVWAMAHMESAASTSTAKSGDCGGCDMDQGNAPAMCAAMCGSIGPAVLSAGAVVTADAAAEYFLNAALTGVSRAPPPEPRPPKTPLAA